MVTTDGRPLYNKNVNTMFLIFLEVFIFCNEGNFTPEQFCKRLVFVFNNLLIDNLVEHPLAYQSP